MQARIERLREALKKDELDAFLISNTININYLTGIPYFPPLERDAFVLIAHKQNFIFTDSRYTGGIGESQKNLTVVESSARGSFYEHLTNIVRHNKWRRIGYEGNNLTVQEFLRLRKALQQKEEQNRGGIHLVDSSTTTPLLRIVKDEDEIKKIRKACEMTDKTFQHILGYVKPGISEKELAFIMETFMRENGAAPAFPTIVAFGPNAAIPHHHTGNTKLKKKGTCILMDFGAHIDGYNADMTRTIFYGSIPSKLEQQYKAVHYAQTKALYALEQSFTKFHKAKAADIDAVARTIISEAGFPELPHSLGHGVGLEVHEAPSLSPRSSEVLMPSMIVTVEPGIYLQGVSGVRIEDTVALNATGIEILTHSPKSIIIL